jgi:hypothetical protein
VIEPRPGNALDGFAVGAEVTLDGAWATVGYYWAQVPRSGNPTVDDYRLEVWSMDGTPAFEAELSALTAGGAGPGDTSAMVAFPQQSENHVSAVAWQNAGSVARYSAVSWDRHPGA